MSSQSLLTSEIIVFSVEMVKHHLPHYYIDNVFFYWNNHTTSHHFCQLELTPIIYIIVNLNIYLYSVGIIMQHIIPSAPA